jgi:hypothetical protein
LKENIPCPISEPGCAPSQAFYDFLNYVNGDTFVFPFPQDSEPKGPRQGRKKKNNGESEDEHKKKCKSLERAIRSHVKQAQRHLDLYGSNFEDWVAPGPPNNYLTGQLGDYQRHVDEAKDLTEQYKKECSDMGPPPTLPEFADVPNHIPYRGRDRHRLRNFRDIFNFPPATPAVPARPREPWWKVPVFIS